MFKMISVGKREGERVVVSRCTAVGRTYIPVIPTYGRLQQFSRGERAVEEGK